MVLHGPTRRALPKSVRTSLAVWVGEHSDLRAMLPRRAQALSPFAKEALAFGGIHGVLKIEQGARLSGDIDADKTLSVARPSDEVVECGKRSVFAGRWLARGGPPSTVMALLGAKP